MPRKYKSQDPKQHSDLYTDENPRGTIKGLGFVDSAKAKQSINKIKNSSRDINIKCKAQCTKGQSAGDGAKNPESKKNLHEKGVQGVH